MTPSFQFVELDKAVHERKSFNCGVEELNLFFQQFAVKHRAAGISMTMVFPAKQNKTDIYTYYTLFHTEIKRQTLASRKEVTLLSASSDADSATRSEQESSGSRAW